MKIRMEVDENLTEDEVVIRVRSLTEDVLRIQRAISESQKTSLELYKGDSQYYIALTQILFFETSDGVVHGHTRDQVYDTGYRLYELEEMLPAGFARISKSAIVNMDQIFSINKNISSSSEIEFAGTHKRVFVSRGYYKELKNKLDQRRART